MLVRSPAGVGADNAVNPFSAMTEVLGQRSLLGVGVLLAWMLLFHLLVNIWLLCVFTSLLVVLGGWLGSQAVLESNSVLHLERFITLEQVASTVEDDGLLDQEIHNTVRKIIRDFVTSWFATVSSESRFETEVQEAMVCMAMELKLRAVHVDRKVLTQRILDLFGCHLQDFIQAKELVAEQQASVTAPKKWRPDESERLWRAYSAVTAPHPATSADAAELNYTRAVVDLLLHVLAPPPHLESRTGRFVVGELITCNVILPLIAKLSDPDWLNVLMVEIFGRSTEKMATTEPPPPLPPPAASSPPPLPPPPTPTPPLSAESELAPAQETTQAPPPPAAGAEPEPVQDAETPDLEMSYEAFESDEADGPQGNAAEDEEAAALPFLDHYIRAGKSNPFYQENDSDLDSPLADSLVLIGHEERVNGVELDVQADPRHPNGTGGGGGGGGGLQDAERDGDSPTVNPARELLLGVDPTPNELAAAAAAASPLPGGGGGGGGSLPMPAFSFEPLSSPDGPVVIQNLRITGTITAKEHRGTGSHPYTLYTIKYETAMCCETPGAEDAAPAAAVGAGAVDGVQASCEVPSRVQPVAYHMVNRRYSEFLNLQTRLEEKTELRKLIKGVKGPKKVFPDMPFGNMDSDKIEARKGLLETFLKQLCAIPEIANSEEMQEFLALNTDARIAFVKKPFIVSRIDKNLMNAIVDTLKTAFPRSEPQSPTEDNEAEVDGARMSGDKKNKSRLKFSSKNIPALNGADIRPPVVFSYEQTSTVFNRKTLADLQSFITEQEKLSLGVEGEREDGQSVAEVAGRVDDDDDLNGNQSPDRASETALADVALNILCLLMKEQWSWICTENVQRTIRLLFGTLIDRWLDVGVANLTCRRYWVLYLQVVQEAVWPGGALPTAPLEERSQRQKDDARQQALSCLMRLLPDVVSDMLGSDKYKLSWETALDSLQDPYINRHLVFCILDLLLEFLVPERPDENFQRNLLQTLSRNPEKLLS